jgi:hypothetical protein
MNPMLVRALVASLPGSMLLVASALAVKREASLGALLQLLGSGFLAIVVLTHFCEALGLLAWMNWGRQHSVGHYVDLASSILGVTLVPGGYLIRRSRKDHFAA